jgi:hypothetical protein
MTTELMKQLEKTLEMGPTEANTILVRYQDGGGRKLISLNSIKPANGVTVMLQDVLNHLDNARNVDVRIKTQGTNSYSSIPRSQYSDRPVMVGDEVYLAAFQRGA